MYVFAMKTHLLIFCRASDSKGPFGTSKVRSIINQFNLVECVVFIQANNHQFIYRASNLFCSTGKHRYNRNGSPKVERKASRDTVRSSRLQGQTRKGLTSTSLVLHIAGILQFVSFKSKAWKTINRQLIIAILFVGEGRA